MNETINVLEKYKTMVSQSIDHHVLLKERTMLQFLEYVLDSPNDVEVSLALEVLLLMADNSQNHQQLRSFGLLEAIDKAAERSVGKENARLATKLSATLKKPFQPLVVRQSAPAHMFPSLIYVFHIPGLTNTTRRDVEFGAISQRGVISVVVDTARSRCTVRALSKVTAPDLASSIHCKSGLPVRLVTKNNKGRETFEDLVQLTAEPKLDVSICSDQADSSLVELEDLPEYLPEEEPPVKSNAVMTFAKLKTGAATLIRSASSFLSDSFYW